MIDTNPEERSVLEDRFPHLIPRLTACWGDPSSFGLLFEDLMFDRRGGRSGWPFDAFQELDLLQEVHRLACGPSDPARDIWDQAKRT